MEYYDFVTYEQAIKLKDLGFDWKCFGYYLYQEEVEFGDEPKDYNFIIANDHISAPTLAQARKWLGEVKDVNIVSNFKFHKGKVKYSWYIVTDNGDRGICDSVEKSIYDTYEQALSAGIDQTLKLIKNEI